MVWCKKLADLADSDDPAVPRQSCPVHASETEITKQGAERYPFDLMYDAEANSCTYDRLIMLSDNLLDLLKSLGARDYMDVQAFIWAVGDHR